MSCITASERLPQLLAGSLDRMREHETLAHLADCEACRRELAFWVKLRQAVAEEAAVAESGLAETVRERLFGPRAASVLGILGGAGRMLRLAGSAYRLLAAVIPR